MTRPSRHLVSLAIGFTAFLCVTGDVWATSCIRTPSILAERFAGSDAVVLARIDGCSQPSTSDGYCQNQEFDFSILEVLKESGTNQQFVSTHKGDSLFGCGLRFIVGHRYLLYLDEDGQILQAYSGLVDDTQEYPEFDPADIQILRDFRDGVIDDLSGPWTFRDSGLNCELVHSLGIASIAIGFDYRPSQYLDSALTFIEGSGPNGEAQFRLRRKEEERLDVTTTLEYDGPEIEDNPYYLRVALLGRKEGSDGRVSLVVGSQSWALYPLTITTSGPMISTRRSVQDLLEGQDAIAFVDSLRSGIKDITIVTTPRTIDIDLGYPEILSTKNTQLLQSIKMLDDCVDGSARRGARILQ